MSKITFLMKVFNGEGFISRSIESVLNQTDPDFTLYIRNNGSTDHSDRICKKYAKRDSRIVYLENRTGGITDDGFRACERGFWPEFNSEYVSIIDHDDILDPDFAVIMYERAKATDAQLTLCGNSFFQFGTNKVSGYRIPPKTVVRNAQELNENFIELYGCFRTVWGKIFETKWYEKHYNIITDAPSGIMSTDTYYILDFLKECECLATVNLPLYHYCVRSGSGFHSAVVKKTRIHDGQVLYYAAKECLEYYRIATNKNIHYLYRVHWGHMVDLMEILCKSNKMLITEKIQFMQDVLNDELLQEYRSEFFDIILQDILKYLKILMPDLENVDVELWSYYLVRFYEVYQNKDNQQMPLLYTMLLSAVCDPENHFSFGLELLSKNDWNNLSPGEAWFVTFSKENQLYYINNLPELKMELAEQQPERYVKLEDALVSAVEAEAYQSACDLLSELNFYFPMDEYAFYYRIYLSVLFENFVFARKQVYMARIFWSESKEILELCDLLLSKPITRS